MRFVNIKKANGEIEKFDSEKLKVSISSAFKDLEYEDCDEHINAVFTGVNTQLEEFPGVFRPTTSQLGSIVEDTLVYLSHPKVAKSFILYRDKKKRMREGYKSFINAVETMRGYLSQADWRVKENSNVNYSIGGLILHSAGSLASNYWLNEVYPERIRDAHVNGDIHLHDLGMLSAYCNGNDLLQLIKEGLGGVPKQTTSRAPKYLRTLMDQMINHLGIMQNEFAGAQAYSNFDTLLAPFVKNESLNYKEVKQNVQHFVFGINVPSRWGCQAPFTNVTMDWTVPEKFKDKKVIIGGKEINFTYGDCQLEMDMINKAFIEVMEAGDALGKGFSYPIPTYNITKDFDWDNKNTEALFKLTSKYGTPYFSNFINSGMSPEDSFSMCCRLRINTKELRRRGGGLFGADAKTGSIGVTTINLPRIAYKVKNLEGDKVVNFFEELIKLMDYSKDSLELKRRVIKNFMDNGLYPYTKRYLGTFDNHFSTIGILGANEACLNLFGKGIADKECQEFVISMLEIMRDRMLLYQEETGNLYNLEATPAEGTSYRLAKKDILEFGDSIITAGTKEAPYYTNSTQLPVGYTEDVFEALDIQDQFQSLYTGGTVFHALVGERVSDWKISMKLVQKIFSNYKLPYLSITPTYSICPIHGYLKGEYFKCPKCLEEIDIINTEITRLETLK